MAERIVTIITTKGAKQSSSAFKTLGTSVIALNQGLELLNKGLQAVTAPFAAVINEGREFGKQMSAVQAVTKATGDEFNQLREEALRLGETTAFSAVEAGQAMEELGRAGQTTAQIIETTGEALNLAAANGIELADSAELIAIQMNVFQKEALKAQKASDLINQTISASPQNFEQFKFAMQFAGQAAAAFNRDFEETTQIIGALAETGIRGSKAGTALSTAFARLAKPAAEAQRVLDKYGITLDQINPAANEFADVIDVLNQANLKQSEIISLLGLETAPKFFSIIEKGGDSIRDFALKQQEANTALEAAQTRLDNLDGDITIFQSALSGLKLAVFESLDDILRSIVQGVTAMVGQFTKFIKNNKGEIDQIFIALGNAMEGVKDAIVLLIRSFGFLLEAIGEIVGTQVFIEIIENWKSAFEAVKDIAVFLAPPLLKVAEIVGGILIKHFLELSRIATKILAVGLELLRDIILGIPEALEKVATWINNVIDGFKWLFRTIGDIGKAIDDLIRSFVMLGKNAIVGAITGISGFVNESAKALESIEDMDHALTGNSLVPSFDELSDKLIAAGKRMQQFSFDAKQAKNEIKKLDDEIQSIQTGAGAVSLSGLSGTNIFSSVINAFKSGANQVGESIKKSFEDSGSVFRGILSGLGSIFSNLVSAVWSLFTSNEKFKNALDRIFETIGRVVSPVIEAFVPVLDALNDSIVELAPFFKEIAQDLTPLIEDLIKFVTDLSKAMQPIIKNIIQKLVPLIQKIVSQLGPVLIKLTESIGPVIDNLLEILIPIIEELLPIIVDIIDLISELNPLIAAVLEIVKALMPIIKLVIRIVAAVVRVIVNVLKPIIQVLTNVIKLIAGLISGLIKIISDVFGALINLIKGLLTAIKNLIEALGKAVLGGIGGGGGGGGSGIPFFPFQQGTGALARDQLLRLPGMEPNAGLVKAHVGESIGQTDSRPMQFIFNIKAIDPKATANELRQLLEELKASGRL